MPLTDKIVAKYCFGAISVNRVCILGEPIPKPIPKIVVGIKSNQIFFTRGTVNRAKAYKMKDALINVVEWYFFDNLPNCDDVIVIATETLDSNNPMVAAGALNV